MSTLPTFFFSKFENFYTLKPTFGLHMRINLSMAIAVSVNIEPKKFISLIDSVITQGTL